MTDLAALDSILLTDTGIEPQRITAEVAAALSGMDDGELYLETCLSEALGFDDGKLKTASYNASRGFGLRAVSDEATGFAHSSDVSVDAIRRAAGTVRAVREGRQGTLALPPGGTNQSLYIGDNPLNGVAFETKVALLAEIDGWLRGRDPRVRQVSCSLSGEWSAVEIIRGDGSRSGDIRPLVRLSISVVVGDGDRMESGSNGAGGRTLYDRYLDPAQWQAQADEALRQALVNLDSGPAPAGEMVVVLGPGWPGVMLHEAIGHGLEGDFNRKQTSAFSGRLGQRIAAPGVTVVDDGTLPDRRGSITVDDEGTPSGRTVLIEDGILTGYMQDRLNARLMGMKPTGNGRRQSYAHHPMPRMTNTFMLAGEAEPSDIIRSVRKGLYAVNFGGGQVDITSGKFVFSASEAYLIEDGKVGRAVKGATLIGNGPDALTRISMIGNDVALDDGVGTCGKDGQSVPVGVGQPTLRIDGLTVGGTGG